ncbi:carbohydrate sulfotransferase 11 [Hyalella azteca]|uniref:Carbohydrate sulfotransferase n=1 Tax=Hyalella azteca TaxID=294128 RepID=A0A8B7NAX7_HYAAZ|nr:carbohydrate sulfotransferase 11 [Hyalella azteca]
MKESSPNYCPRHFEELIKSQKYNLPTTTRVFSLKERSCDATDDSKLQLSLATSSGHTSEGGQPAGLRGTGRDQNSAVEARASALTLAGSEVPRWWPRQWKPSRRTSFLILSVALYAAAIFIYGRTDEEGNEQLSLREWVVQNEDVLQAGYRERAALARGVCSDLGVNQRRQPHGSALLTANDRLALRRVHWEFMYFARVEGLLYCKVPKSGSSTWVYNLLKLAGVSEENLKTDVGLHKILRDFYPRPSSRQQSKYKRSLKLLVVRHPFDRILSAYRDKLENYERDLLYRNGYYHKVYGRDIVRVHRNASNLEDQKRIEPTWPEFASYLLSTPASQFDEHWKPIYLMCSPCAMDYDVIAKMETFSEDTQYVINELGLAERLSVEWIHASGSKQTSDLATAYYSQLTRRQVYGLLEKYALDFELFGYDPAHYIQASHA